jgi:hypothetical protein
MSALDAARLNVQRAGQDVSLLDGLRTAGQPFRARTSQAADDEVMEDEQEEVALNGTSPLSLARRR